MYSCKECNKQFQTFQEKANHVRWNHKDNSEFKRKIKISAIKSNEKIYGKWIEENVKCSKEGCNSSIKIKYREGKKRNKYFCSKSCASSRGSTKKYFTKEVRKKLSESSKRAWEEGKYNNKNNRFNSKNELAIVKHFKENYPQYEWKSGGRLDYNGIGISRDLYSNILKVCFEYDGIWHFVDIKGQLKNKQLKDKALEDWCKENKYRLIRISEEEYKNFQQVEELIFENCKPIVKIGKGY